MPKSPNLLNRRFYFLIVKEKLGKDKHSNVLWKCLCDCGNICIVRTFALGTRSQMSCGCYNLSRIKTHGMKHTSEYHTWISMKMRVLNPNNNSFTNYGGRGIKVCERWLNSFENFFKDMGKRPTSKHTIERIDNNGNYVPENCKWATMKEQCNNRRNNIIFEFNDKSKTISQWAEYLKLPRYVIYNRFRAKWKIKDILETPLKKSKYLTFQNKTMTIKKWSAYLDIPQATIYRRIQNNQPIKKIFKKQYIHIYKKEKSP